MTKTYDAIIIGTGQAGPFPGAAPGRGGNESCDH
jgi:tRNA U34 5-carboxymethylaminomethyl modifying enzyme MnmG/GidA